MTQAGQYGIPDMNKAFRPCSNIRQRGLALAFMLVAASQLLLLSIGAYLYFHTTRLAQTSQVRSRTNDLLTQAAMAISAESSDSDGDGTVEAPAEGTASVFPAGGGVIPAASGAPKTDGYGTPFGYCSWDNGTTNTSSNRITGDNPAADTSVVFAIISAGPDRTFQTSCANLKAGVVNGDDIAQYYTVASLRQGVTGTAYYGASVKDPTALAALPTAGIKTGTMRPVIGSQSLAQWNGSYWATVASGAPAYLGQSFKNYLINGNFTLAQRNGLGSKSWTGTDQTYCTLYSCSLYHPDRWRVRFSTSGTNSKVTLTETLYAFTPAVAGNPPGAANYAELTPSALTGTLTYYALEQGIEQLAFFQGRQMVLSFWAKSPAPVTVTVKSDEVYGYGSGTYTATSTTTLGSITTSTNWTQYSIPFTVPAPTSTPTYLAKNELGIGYLTVYFSVAAMQTLDLALIQLEDGTTPTPFEFRPPSVELSLAQRYYQRNDPSGRDNTYTAYFNSNAYLRRISYNWVRAAWIPYTSYTENSTQITSGTLTNTSTGPVTATWRATTDTTTGMKTSTAYWWAEAEYGE